MFGKTSLASSFYIVLLYDCALCICKLYKEALFWNLILVSIFTAATSGGVLFEQRLSVCLSVNRINQKVMGGFS